MPDKKILFIAYFYPPVSGTGLPGAQRIVKFLRYRTSKENYVLTVDPDTYPENMEKSNSMVLPVREEKIFRTKIFDIFGTILKLRSFFKKDESNYKTEKIAPDPQKKTSLQKKDTFQKIKDIISNILTYPDFAGSWFFPAFFQGIKIIRQNNIDIIFATGMPWTSLIIGIFLKLATGKKLIVDFRDPWVNNPYVRKEAFIKYIDRKLESFIIRKSDLVIANTDMLRKEFVNRHPSLFSKFIVLPNGYDEYDFQNLPDIQLPRERLIISHAGLLYPKRDPIALLKALELIKEKKPEISEKIQFHQIGNVNLDYEIGDYCHQRNIDDNLKIMGLMEHKKCLGYLKASDLLFLIQPDTKTQIPSKLYEYIYLNKPILAITDKEGALGKAIETYDFGKVFESNDYEGIADFLMEMLSHKLKEADSNFIDYKNKEKFDVKNICAELERHIEKF